MRKRLIFVSIILPALLLAACRVSLSADAAPAVNVVSVKRVFDNGEHNAFTDLCRFRDRYYLTFRSCPDGHGVNPTSSIIILTSGDARSWKEAFRFSVSKRDVRDPHFLIFRDRLFVYTGAWYSGDTAPKSYDLNEHLGYGVWSENGETWQGPIMLEGTYGHYIWRAATFGDKAYLCGRRKREFLKTATRAERDPLVESAMLESDDGLVWRKRALFQEQYGNETAFLFEQNGAVLAVARGGGQRNAELCRSPPPYSSWTRQDLGRYIGGPLVVRWGERTLVGGRKNLTGEPKTSLYWLVDGQLHEFAELPSAGDNSYPGFVALSDRRALVSYYSSHERNAAGDVSTNIYLAELEIASARE